MKTHTHTRHAPGPWLDSGHDGKRNVIVESQLGSVAAVWDTGDAMQMRANARLIASAPDLLAALEQVYAQLGGHHSFDVSDLRLKVVKTAIAKAKGTP